MNFVQTKIDGRRRACAFGARFDLACGVEENLEQFGERGPQIDPVATGVVPQNREVAIPVLEASACLLYTSDAADE